MKGYRKYIEALEDDLKKAIEKLSGQLALHAHHTPETPEEAFACEDSKAFFDCWNYGILDLIERADRIAEIEKNK